MSADGPQTSAPRSLRSPITISEYVQTQRAHGSCAEEFKAGVTSCGKAGLAFGVPLGLWVSYSNHGLKPTLTTARTFALKTLSVTLMSFVTFAGMGVAIGTYNCLRVVRE